MKTVHKFANRPQGLYNLIQGKPYKTHGALVEQQFTADQVEQALDGAQVTYLGTGAFGETWRGRTPEHDAAYKIIYRDDASLERLKREIESYRRVNSPNVVRLDNALPLMIANKKRPTLIFEFIDGGDLSQAIQRTTANAEELHELALGLLSGISALHSAELLHRDLKPANVALREGDYTQPVILDLGLAKLMDVESITRYPQAVGTPMYMAPEQLRGERALKASDLWAVGVILYEAATGRHPFVTPNETITWDEFFERLKKDLTIPISIPDAIADLINRCLSEKAFKRGTVAKAISRLKGR